MKNKATQILRSLIFHQMPNTYASFQPLSFAICCSSSDSFAKFVVPSVKVCSVATVASPLMTFMSESCVKFGHSDKLNETGIFIAPVILSSAVSRPKQ